MFWRQQAPQQSSLLQQHVETVEQILYSININPQQAQMPTQNGYGWSFQQGSALIEIYLAEQEGREYLQVLAPLFHLPQQSVLPLYRRLLELNLSLTNASLGVYLDVVYVFNERPLTGLGIEEANFIIKQIAQYADDLDDQLVKRFGGRLFGQT